MTANNNNELVMGKRIEIPVKRYSGHIRSPEVYHSQDSSGKKLYDKRTNSPIRYIRWNIECDLTEEVDGWDGVFKGVSVPANLTPGTKAGQLVSRLGFELDEGQKFNVQDLDGLHVSFDTELQVTENGGRFTKPLVESMYLNKDAPVSSE